MLCPICGKEMQEGGLIVNGVSAGWVPMEQFQKKGFERLVYTGYKSIGSWNALLDQTKVPNAWFCEDCNKVTGVFDVTN